MIRRLLTCILLASASPALADHTGPSSVDGGAALNVIGGETLEKGHASLGLRLAYTRPDDRSDAELEALAGQHIHAHNSDYVLNAAAGFAYGITDNLTVSAELPYVRRDDLREGEHSHVGGVAVNEVVELGTVEGIGDASVIAKYRLFDGHAKLALVGGLKMPTGSTHQRSNDGERLETEHQPGTGSWDPVLGGAFSAPLGWLNFNASALYQLSGKGAQHTRLGDRLQGGVALSHHFGPAEHHHDEEGEEHHHDVHGHASWDGFLELTGEWEGRQEVDGEIEEASGGKSVWLSPGARYNSAAGFTLAAAAGVPVWQRIRDSHPDNDYRLTVSIGHRL